VPDFECRLKKYRLLKDLTQEQLAAQVGVRRETIMWLENTIPHLNWRSILQGLSKRRSKKSLFSSDLCGTNRPAVNDGVLHGMK
jgi:transcriptional regulator with XRE-family HTH domain